MTDDTTHRHGAPGPDEWDEKYAEAEQIWSGRPNQALLAETADLQPGRAVDIGCGEGADAVWLSQQGWDVTALDVSSVALDRARGHARDVGVEVRWLHSGLLDASLPEGGFDLVSAQYPALLRTPDHEAEHALAAAVAPGGVLLVVHHAGIDTEHAKESGFDPADYVTPEDVASVLDDGWEVALDLMRPRDERTGAGAHHHHDIVLHARRRR